MTQTLMRALAPALFGAVTATTFLMAPQAAQAGKVSAGARIDFTDLTLTRNGTTNLLAGSTLSTNSSLSLNSEGVAQTAGPIFVGPTVAPTTLDTGVLSLTNGGASSATGQGIVSVTPATANIGLARISNSFELFDAPPTESSNNTTNEQVTTRLFTFAAGDTINLKLDLFIDYFAKIEGFSGNASKLARAQINSSYTIQRANGTDFFTTSPFNQSVTVQDVNDEQGNSFSIDDFVLNIPITEAGQFRVIFNTNLTTQGFNQQATVPEPSAVLGLAGVALVGVLARKRRG